MICYQFSISYCTVKMQVIYKYGCSAIFECILYVQYVSVLPFLYFYAVLICFLVHRTLVMKVIKVNLIKWGHLYLVIDYFGNKHLQQWMYEQKRQNCSGLVYVCMPFRCLIVNVVFHFGTKQLQKYCVQLNYQLTWTPMPSAVKPVNIGGHILSEENNVMILVLIEYIYFFLHSFF